MHFDINVTLFQYIFTTTAANRTEVDNIDQKMNYPDNIDQTI